MANMLPLYCLQGGDGVLGIVSVWLLSIPDCFVHWRTYIGMFEGKIYM